MTPFAKNLRAIRKTRALTQQQLGELIGVHHSHISKWEKGEYEPGQKNFRQLAQALGVSLAELLGRTQYNTEIPAIGTSQQPAAYTASHILDSQLHSLYIVQQYLDDQRDLVSNQIKRLEDELAKSDADITDSDISPADR